MNITKNIKIQGAANRSFLADIYSPNNTDNASVVIFIHGFKGFKDWGHWPLIARQFAEAGYVFVSFNFSHNGTTLSGPSDFEDLEAFGRNTYSKELYDTDQLLNWLFQDAAKQLEINLNTSGVYLVGHSRGGGIGMIKAAEDERVKAVISWAAVSRLDYMWQDNPQLAETWKAEGKIEILNGRTRQLMPIYKEFQDDFEVQKERLDIKRRLKDFRKPMLIIHGSEDPAVPVEAALQLHRWCATSNLHIIDGADHVFGGSHPFNDTQLHPHADELVKVSLGFLDELK